MDASGDTLSVLTLVRVLKCTRRGSRLSVSKYCTRRKAARDSNIVSKLYY